jgi:hypothetical protein
MKKLKTLWLPITTGVIVLSILFYIIGLPAILKYTLGYNSIEPTFDGPKTATSTPAPGSLILDEQFKDDGNWDSYQNLHGEVIAVPEGRIIIKDGKKRIIITRDPDHKKFEKTYNNLFSVSKVTFQPTEYQKIVAQWTMTVDPGIVGSTGDWLHKATDFENGHLVNGKFTWAFGVNFLSNHSWLSRTSGVSVTFVEGWIPKCTILAPHIDETVENTYRIEWTLEGWSAYINGDYIGTCNIPINEPAVMQTWLDNNWVPIMPLYKHLNPKGPQGTTYGPIQIWHEAIP